MEGSGVTQATLNGLRPYTHYAIVLQAFNSRGAGPTSNPTIGTTLEDSEYLFFLYYLSLKDRQIEADRNLNPGPLY